MAPLFRITKVESIHIFNVLSFLAVTSRCLLGIVDYSIRLLCNCYESTATLGVVFLNLASLPVLTRLTARILWIFGVVLFVLLNILFLMTAFSINGFTSRSAAFWGRMMISYISIFLSMIALFARAEESASRVRFALAVLPYLMQLHETAHAEAEEMVMGEPSSPTSVIRKDIKT